MNNADGCVFIESERLQVAVSKADGSWKILHKPAGTSWTSEERFCKLELYNLKSKESRVLKANNFKEIRKVDDSITLIYEPLTDLKMNFKIELTDSETVRFSYQTESVNPEWMIRSVNILDEAPKVIGDGYAVVPIGMGYAIPTTAKIKFETNGTYVSSVFTFVEGGYFMRFLGLVKGASRIGEGVSAAVITWHSPDVNVALRTEKIGGRSGLVPTITLTNNAREASIHFIEKGNFVDVAKYYRGLVMKEGLFVPLEDKIRKNPNLRRLIGTVHFLPLCKFGMSEKVDPKGAPEWYRRAFNLDLKPGSSIVLYTFEEVAEIAEHLKNEVKIDRAYLNIFGWMNGGHDMYYPDYLPADMEMGGNEELIAASKKIRSLGYLFSLYINPILQFEEAASTSPEDAVTFADGKKYYFNFFAGGPSYVVCPSRVIKYMEKTLPDMKRFFSPSVSYIDYMMAVPLHGCHDPNHPLTREETIKHHKRIIEYFKSQLADIVAAETPYEYVIPIIDLFYGWLNFEQRPGLVRIPLTELVYRECGVFSTWMGKMARVSDEAPRFYINVNLVDFISVGRAASLYLPPHLYYERKGAAEVENIYGKSEGGWPQSLCSTDRLIKNAYEVTSPLYEVTFNTEMTNFEFLTPDYKVCKTTFNDGTVIVVNRSDEELDFNYNGIIIPRHGFIVESPTFIAFCVKSYNGIKYSRPTLFTVRSLDNRRIENSKNLRIYHGFGDNIIAIKNTNSAAYIGGSVIKKKGECFIFDVTREANVKFQE